MPMARMRAENILNIGQSVCELLLVSPCHLKKRHILRKVHTMLNLVKFDKNIKEVTTNTLKIAEVFEKRHDRVLRAVNKILGDVRDIEDFTHPKNEASNERKISPVRFMLDSYIDDSGKHCKQYILNKEAFYLLAMGFTGKKALQFKLEFINAFNAMEKALSEKSDKPVVVSEHTRALPSGKKEIVLSDKAKTEIGGIAKAVLQAELTKREAIKDVLREVIREEFSSCVLKTVESESDKITADGLPIGNWLVGIVHGANAVGNCFNQMLARQNQAVKLLAK